MNFESWTDREITTYIDVADRWADDNDDVASNVAQAQQALEDRAATPKDKPKKRRAQATLKGALDTRAKEMADYMALNIVRPCDLCDNRYIKRSPVDVYVCPSCEPYFYDCQVRGHVQAKFVVWYSKAVSRKSSRS